MNLLSSLLKYTADQIAALRAKDTSQDSTVSGINTRLTTAEGDIDSLEAQFTTVVSAVTTDTEVTNIRVGDDGATYDTAGNAVRKQFSDVKSGLISVFPDNGTLQKGWFQGAYTVFNDPPSKASSSTTRISNHISLTAKEKVRITGNDDYEYIFSIYHNASRKRYSTTWASIGREFSHGDGVYDVYITIRRKDGANIEPQDAYSTGIYILADDAEYLADGLAKELKDNFTEVRTYNLFNVNGAVDDARYVDGIYTENSNHALWTEYIDVEDIECLYSNRLPTIYFFDANYEYLDYIINAPYTIPNNAKYAQIGANKSSQFYINRNTVVIADNETDASYYVPYSYKQVAQSVEINGMVTPEQFGAYGDGVNDDSDAIQTALNTGKTVKLSKRYYITKTLIVHSDYQKICSDGGIASNRVKGRIQSDKSGSYFTDGAFVKVIATGVTISGIGFRYTGESTGRTGLLFNRISDIERREFDMDCTVEGCWFDHLNTGVRYIGRGLRLSGCHFGSCTYSVYLSLPAIYDSEGDGYPLVNPFGGRGMLIVNNRVHNGSPQGALVYITGSATETYLGMVIEGNVIDHRGNLLYSEAMQRELVISGNTVVNNTDSTTKIEAITVKYADGCVISNNTISAVRTQSEVDAEMEAAGITYNETITHTPPNYGMSLGENGHIKNGIISNNVIKGFTDGGIKNGTIQNSIVKNNIYPVKLFYDDASVDSGCIVSDNLAQV